MFLAENEALNTTNELRKANIENIEKQIKALNKVETLEGYKTKTGSIVTPATLPVNTLI